MKFGTPIETPKGSLCPTLSLGRPSVPIASAPVLPLAGTSDERLRQLGAAGDRAAIGELYDRYGGRSYRLAAAICLDPYRAERVVQDAFAALLAHRWPGDSPGWLLRSVYRHAVLEADDSGQSYLPLVGLSGAQTECILLARLADLTTAEIAAQRNVPVAVITGLMREGLRGLSIASPHAAPPARGTARGST